jgi:AcrR family transcriptional regulator
VPRTLDPEAHALRREAYTDAAIRLIQAKGYGQLSIQAVIDEVGASKGAFFHYFDSKEALLAAVVERMVEIGVGMVAPVAADPRLTALEKFEGIFAGIARWKSSQPEFQPAAVEEMVRTWYSDENSLVLERLRSATKSRLAPLLVGILRHGAADGSFSIDSPEGTASVCVSLMLGVNDVAITLFLARRAGTVSLETVRCTLAAYTGAFERILGLRHLAWPLMDEASLRFWFD